jgi:hypothetical protein
VTNRDEAPERAPAELTDEEWAAERAETLRRYPAMLSLWTGRDGVSVTDEMIEAGAEAIRRSFRNGDEGMAYACFMAMVGASPAFAEMLKT